MNQFGKGNFYYIGSALDNELMDALYLDIFKEKGVGIMASSGDNIEAVTRTGADESVFLSVVNHSTEEAGTLTLPEGTWVDPVSHKEFSGEMLLAPLAAHVLRSK
ncbi:hypothetical protein ABFG93_14405 [Pseudalkalibacillus hwajinpoensis]|uniref:hypothetical protein n=1 Tax=Guptibacillus hwajinpoensis TaxID=208199 RepID=UPI003243D877